MKKTVYFVFALAVPFFAGGVGSLFTASEINTWYRTLEKPFFNPPDYIFGPVWTLLYLMMGISFFLVLISKERINARRIGLNWFFVQLVLNAVWSIVFFRFHMPAVAFLVIIFLWFAIFKTIRNFSKVSLTAGMLLWPYIAWVSFATLLNLAIMLLN